MNAKKILSAISFFITVLTLAAVTVLFFMMPTMTRMYLNLVDRYTEVHYSMSILLGRTALVIAALALSALLWLLLTVGRGKVFSATTAHIMTLLSLCCFGEMTVFFILGSYFLLSYVVTFAALMLGILLLVLRCVLVEATEIKQENDYTV